VRTSALFGAKKLFSKSVMCPHGHGGCASADFFGQWGRGQFFSDVFYGRPLIKNLKIENLLKLILFHKKG